MNEIHRDNKSITTEGTLALLQAFETMVTFPDWGSARDVYENIKPKMYIARAQRLSQSLPPARHRKVGVGVNVSEPLPPYEACDVHAAVDDQIKRRGDVSAKTGSNNGLAILGTASLTGKDGITLSAESLQGKFVGLYFSAHWCSPCKMFTPLLARKYLQIVGEGHPFEIIFVSSDYTSSEATLYYSEMPWLMLSYSDRTTKDKLVDVFKVSGIPTLVLLDRQGNVLATDGRSTVMSSAFENWDPADDGVVYGEGEAAENKAVLQQIKYIEAEPEEDDVTGESGDDDDIIESLEAACAELGYTLEQMDSFLTCKEYPEELIALLVLKTGKKAKDVRRMILPQSGKLLERVKSILRQMEEVKTKEEEAKQEKLRKLGPCPMDFEWLKVEGGYRCAGGTHFCTDQEIDQYCVD